MTKSPNYSLPSKILGECHTYLLKGVILSFWPVCERIAIFFCTQSPNKFVISSINVFPAVGHSETDTVLMLSCAKFCGGFEM